MEIHRVNSGAGSAMGDLGGEEVELYQDLLRKLQEKHSDVIPPQQEDIESYDDIEDRLVTFIARITGVTVPVLANFSR